MVLHPQDSQHETEVWAAGQDTSCVGLWYDCLKMREKKFDLQTLFSQLHRGYKLNIMTDISHIIFDFFIDPIFF